MGNKYENEIRKDENERDKLLILGITSIYKDIRDKVLNEALKVKTKAKDRNDWFSKRAGRKERFAKDLNKKIRPDYIKRDLLSKRTYFQEYPTTYFQGTYIVENKGISDGYKFKLPKFRKTQLKEALNYPLSKLGNNVDMKISRTQDISRLYNVIVSGIEQGKSLPNIGIDIDIELGFRDAKGSWISQIVDRKGQQYKTQRILRTEILRMRNAAQTDQWKNQQEIVPSKLMLVETLDNRTRAQSAQMDGQFANKEGKFEYPNGQYSFLGRSGVAKWDINDRGTTVNIDPEYPPESRIQRVPVFDKKLGKRVWRNKTVPYKNFPIYANEQGLVKNKYGEYLSRNLSDERVKVDETFRKFYT